MRQTALLCFSLLLFLFLFSGSKPVDEKTLSITNVIEISESARLFEELDLKGKVSFDAFEQALKGYHGIANKQKEVLTLIDFTKPSTEERMYVIDMVHRKVLFETHVAHGQNSGDKYATSFSNRSGSHQSSLGFFLTENTYNGRNGYSLVLNGLESGVNDNAKARAVVIHGAAYANPATIASRGRLGRSWGCPALPQELNKPIIDVIKNGSVLYIYADNPDYFAQSSILLSGENTTL